MAKAAFDPIQPPSTIVVTGANGFIAAHVVQKLLEDGYHVLGTVRSTAKVKQVLSTHHNNNNLSVCVVSDITNAEELKKCIESSLANGRSPAAILHLAAPFSYHAQDFETDLLRPAIYGTEAILHVARHFQDTGLRMVVHTNSFACIYDAGAGPRPEKTYTAADWAPLTYEDGLKAPNAPAAYRAAKAVAEKTAWAFMEEHADQIKFGFVSLCPAMVFGPFVGALPPSSEDLNESNKLVWDIVRQGKGGAIPPTKAPVWVDVRDVARAHVLALRTPDIAGKRLLLAAGVYCNQEIADEARQACPQFQEHLPVGEVGKREQDKVFKVDSSKESKLLGLQWSGLGTCLTDLVPQLMQYME